MSSTNNALKSVQ